MELLDNSLIDNVFKCLRLEPFKETICRGTFVISWVDNIIRPMVISGNSHIPFLLVLLVVALVQGFVRVFGSDQPASVALPTPSESGDVSST